jgi:hypothetical protein
VEVEGESAEGGVELDWFNGGVAVWQRTRVGHDQQNIHRWVYWIGGWACGVGGDPEAGGRATGVESGGERGGV